jgi:hypothetical protein
LEPALKHLAVCLLALSLVGCAGGIQTWTVDPNMQPCWGMAPAMCLGYTLDDGTHDSMLGRPSGFDFQWGVVQTIEVLVTPVPNPPADGSSIDYDLVSVIESEEVADGTTFSLNLDLDHLSAGSPGQFSLLGTTVNAPDADVEQAIHDGLDAGEPMTVTFEYGDANSLVAISVE